MQFPSNRRRVSTVHRPRTPFSHTHGLSQSLVKVCSPGSRHLVRLIPRIRVAQAQHEVRYIVLPKSVHVTSRHVLHYTFDEQHTFTCTPSFSTIRPTSISSNFLPGEIEPCADPRHVSIGCLADPITFTLLEGLKSLISCAMTEGSSSRENFEMAVWDMSLRTARTKDWPTRRRCRMATGS